MSVAIAPIHTGQTNQALATATPYNPNSRNSRSGPGVPITTCLLSPTVENLAGRAMRITAEGTANKTDWYAQGPVTQAMTSTKNRSPVDNGVSNGCLNSG